jgi:hypothetical protein
MAQNQSLEADLEGIAQSAAEDFQPRKRAIPTCSDCHIIGHNRRQCPNRVTN